MLGIDISRRQAHFFVFGSVVAGLLFVMGVVLTTVLGTIRASEHVTAPLNKGSRSTLDEIKSLMDLSSIEDNYRRYVALDTLIMKSNAQKLQVLFENTSSIDSTYIRHRTQDAILKRLVALKPIVALEKINNFPLSQRTGATEIVVSEWSIRDLPNTIAHFKIQEEDVRKIALLSIIRNRQDLPEFKLREIGVQLNLEVEALDLIQLTQAENSFKDLNSSLERILTDGKRDFSQLNELLELGSMLFDRDRFVALEYINESISDTETREPILQAMLEQSCRINPDLTLKQGIKYFTENPDVVLDLARTCSQQNPRSTLQSLYGIEASSALSQKIFEIVIESWAQLDPYELIENVDQIPSNYRSFGYEQAFRLIAEMTPLEGVVLLANRTDDRYKFAQILVTAWGQLNSHEAIDWVLTDPTIAQFRRDLMSEILWMSNDLSTSELEFLIAKIQSLPNDAQDSSWTSVFLSSLAIQDINQALNLASGFQDQTAKLNAYSIIGSIFISKKQVKPALNLYDQLPLNQQKRYLQDIVRSWAGQDPQGLYNSIDDLPTTSSKSSAARYLTAFDKIFDSLTDEQLGHLRSYLSDVDASALTDANWQNWF